MYLLLLLRCIGKLAKKSNQAKSGLSSNGKWKSKEKTIWNDYIDESGKLSENLIYLCKEIQQVVTNCSLTCPIGSECACYFFYEWTSPVWISAEAKNIFCNSISVQTRLCRTRFGITTSFISVQKELGGFSVSSPKAAQLKSEKERQFFEFKSLLRMTSMHSQLV